MILEAIEKRVGRAMLEYQASVKILQSEKEGLARAVERVTAVEEAQELAQTVAQEVQQQAHSQIAGVVSRCIEAVFGNRYTFQIIFERKRGKTEAELLFFQNGEPMTPMEASGGGIIDIAAFALRLACLNLSRPEKRLTMILDEPFKFVSKIYRPRVRELLETLSEEMSVQIIMVTHEEEYIVGKVIELGEPK